MTFMRSIVLAATITVAAGAGSAFAQNPCGGIANAGQRLECYDREAEKNKIQDRMQRFDDACMVLTAYAVAPKDMRNLSDFKEKINLCSLADKSTCEYTAKFIASKKNYPKDTLVCKKD